MECGDEAASLAAADIGVMPLSDDALGEGRVRIQVAAIHGRSAAVRGLAGRREHRAVIDGFNGFHATSLEEWERNWSG